MNAFEHGSGQFKHFLAFHQIHRKFQQGFLQNIICTKMKFFFGSILNVYGASVKFIVNYCELKRHFG